MRGPSQSHYSDALDFSYASLMACLFAPPVSPGNLFQGLVTIESRQAVLYIYTEPYFTRGP